MNPATPICECPACRWRSLRAPLALIAVGVLLLLHMTGPAWTVPVAVGGFLVFLGAQMVVENVLPRAAGVVHRGSRWAGAILLLVIGGLMIAAHAVPGFQAGAWLARYWPLLFIAWGVGRLIEYYAAPQQRTSGLGGGEIVLLISLVLIGLAYSSAYRYRQARWTRDFGIHLEDWNPMFQGFYFNAQSQATLAPNQRLEVDGYRGNVRLIPAAPGTHMVAAAVSDEIHALDQNAAADLFQQAQPHLQAAGEEMLVTPAGAIRNGQVRANTELTLPASTAVAVTLNSGNIEADHWQAPLQLSTGHSLVQARQVTGDIDVAATSDRIDLEDVTGNVNVHGTGSDVTLAHIGGTATLRGEYSGRLHFEDLRHGLNFDSMRTSLAFDALPGGLDGGLDRLTFRAPVDDIRLTTRNKEVTVTDFTGSVNISDTNSNVRLAAAQAPTAAIVVSTTNGDIDLQLPAGSHFELNATVHNGSIDNDFGIDVTRHGASASAVGSAGGGGPEITLSTHNGHISVHH